MKEVSLKMRKVQDDLDLLPQSFADNPQAGLLALCSEFISETDEYINGTPDHATFFQELHGEFWKLTQEIIGTRPTFETTPTSSRAEPVAITNSFAFVPPSPLTEADRLLEQKRNGLQPLKGKKNCLLIYLTCSHLT
jgi:hypothetical protein